jgi:hypothetical protein
MKTKNAAEFEPQDEGDDRPVIRFTYGRGIGESPQNPIRPRRFEEIRTGWNLITPEIASFAVKRTQHLSKEIRSKRHFQGLVRDMENEEWDENGEALIVSENGLINDGTHRFAACAHSGKPIVTMCVVGVSDKLKDTYGRGAVLNAAQYLKAYLGIKNATSIAAAAHTLLHYKNRSMMTRTAPTKRDEIISLSTEIEPIASKYVTVASGPMFRGKIGCGKVIAVFVVADVIDQKMSHEIEESMRTQMLYPGTALHSFSVRLTNMSTTKGDIDISTRTAMMINTFNAHRAGLDKKIIAAKEGSLSSDNFPVLWGVQPEDLPF